MAEENKLKSMSSEICFVGALYKYPEQFVMYNDRISAEYDFSDPVTKFFYNNLDAMVQMDRVKGLNEIKINVYMSEDAERLKTYKSYGGYKTLQSFMAVGDIKDLQIYFNMLKKYALLREYDRKGINVEKIINHENFNNFTAADVYKIENDLVNRVYTNIAMEQKNEVLTEGMTSMVESFLEKPQVGKPLPWPILNVLYSGMLTQRIIGWGMLSNLGKTRMLIDIIAYLAIVNQENCFLLVNEMTESQVRSCLLTTVINNPIYEKYHGIHLDKPEKEIRSALYHDEKGDVITRTYDDFGEPTLTTAQYNQYLMDHSEEYRKIMAIAKWLEDKVMSKIYIKDICMNYSDETLIREIKTAHLTKGIRFFFYDTLKDENDRLGDWTGLKRTVNSLKIIANTLNCHIMYTFQLTDDSEMVDPYDLCSMNIANSKQMKHLVDGLVLSNEIKFDELNRFQYKALNIQNGQITDWENEYIDISAKPGRKYYIFVMDKNRDGEKKKILMEVDLNRNTWVELGEVFRKEKRAVEEFSSTRKGKK